MSRSNHSSSSHSHETKGQKIGRSIVAFLLFLSVVALSASVCIQQYFLNPYKYVKIFTNQQYVESLYQDVLEYSYDMCDKNAIPRDSVNEIITFDSVAGVNSAYAYGNLANEVEFTETTYIDKIDSLKDRLTQSTIDMLDKQGISTNPEVENGAEVFADSITQYLDKKVQFVYMDKLQTVVNVGKTASIAMIIASAIICVVFALILISIGEKKYRNIRATVYSFTASGLLQLTMVAGVQVVKKMKSLVIYPSYLCDSVMRFVNNGELAVVASAFCSLIIAIFLCVMVWKQKRNQK